MKVKGLFRSIHEQCKYLRKCQFHNLVDLCGKIINIFVSLHSFVYITSVSSTGAAAGLQISGLMVLLNMVVLQGRVLFYFTVCQNTGIVLVD